MMILGIDIAKASFDVVLYQAGTVIATGQFSNDTAGFKKLKSWLKKKSDEPVWACLEATGRYGDKLAVYLFEQGHQVSLVNPARIKKYRESKLQRTKNDKVDARLIADFCETQKPALWQPPAPELRQLQEMSRRREALIKQQTQEKNRLQAGLQSDLVIASHQASLAFLGQQIQALDEQILAHIQHHPALKLDHDLLVSIKGIGPKTATIILAELPPVANFQNAGQAVAYAGLSPEQHTSGSSVHKQTRLTHIGNQHLKTSMFFPALSAIRHNPIIIALAQRLQAAGKPKMVIVGAAMRKLLQLAFGVLKSRLPFDPDFASKSQLPV